MSWKIPEGTIFYHYGEELAPVSQTFDIQPHHVGGWLIDKTPGKYGRYKPKV